MYLLVEANTDRGRRRFIIGGDSGREAEALIRTFVDEDDRIMDESGEWFDASEIDVASIAARHLPSADITTYIERSKPYLPQGATSTTFQCTNNPHIPACRVPTDGCGTTGTPTDFTCATLVSNCGC